MSIFFNKLIKSTEKFAAGALQEKNCRYNSVFFTAQVAKLVDAGDSKSPAARCVGSSPTLGTMENKPRFAVIFLPVIFASSPVYTSSLPNHLPILPKQSPNKRLIYPYLQSHCKSHTKPLCHYRAHVFLGKTRFMPALATHLTPIFNALR